MFSCDLFCVFSPTNHLDMGHNPVLICVCRAFTAQLLTLFLASRSSSGSVAVGLPLLPFFTLFFSLPTSKRFVFRCRRYLVSFACYVMMFFSAGPFTFPRLPHQSDHSSRLGRRPFPFLAPSLAFLASPIIARQPQFVPNEKPLDVRSGTIPTEPAFVLVHTTFVTF